MKKNTANIAIFALLVTAGLALAGSAGAYAQRSQTCISNEAIIPLVKAKKITSFVKIERKLRLQKGAKTYGQKLCEVKGRYVYFFKVVDSYGRTKKFALYADDGSPYKGND
ncbi:hypothetical protein [Maritalea porphyrae]|uniref:hypothetical protein n=1 Tax=Maritalea porphyrae TaxID=880732 RepID=UPI0022AEF53C|nr:hypothetical protein [Maritalea porphyrae]MCZ4271146.1 hypothetical protein [Maritalea porphyrae]